MVGTGTTLGDVCAVHRFSIFLRDERGASAVEYALLSGLISIVIIVTMPTIGTELQLAYSKVILALRQANAG